MGSRICRVIVIVVMWFGLGGTAAYGDGLDCHLNSYLGSFDSEGLTRAVDLVGHTAYIADSELGLLILDVSDPTDPVLLGSYATPGLANGVVVENDIAYVADLVDGGLRVIDVSDSMNPIEIGYLESLGSMNRIAYHDGLVFIGGGGGVRVIDVSDPTTPEQVSIIIAEDFVTDILVSEGLLYIAVNQFGLEIYEFSDSLNPVRVGYIDVPGPVYGVHVEGDIAFLADGVTWGFEVVDVSNPSVPVLLSTLTVPGEAWKLDVVGDRAFVAARENGLHIIDVSDLKNPRLITSMNLDGRTSDVVAENGVVYSIWNTSGTSGMQIFDLSSLESVEIGSYDAARTLNNVAIDGVVAYVSSFFGGIFSVDVSAPESPQLLNVLRTDRSLPEEVVLAIDGAVLYTGYSSGGGLISYDITDPLNPIELDYFNGIRVESIDFYDGFAYVGTRNGGGLRIFDVSDPSRIQLERIYNPHDVSTYYSAKVDYPYLYSAVGDGLEISSILDPQNPQAVSFYEPVGSFSIESLHIQDSVAVISSVKNLDDVYRKAHIIDVSDPVIPQFLSKIDIGRKNARSVYVQNEIAYIETEGVPSEYFIVDISDPLHVEYRGRFGRDVSDMIILDSLMYICGTDTQGGRGLVISDALNVHSGCAADLDGNWELDFFDISGFLNAYANGESMADFNGDGEFDFFDISAFLSAYAAGCP